MNRTVLLRSCLAAVSVSLVVGAPGASQPCVPDAPPCLGERLFDANTLKPNGWSVSFGNPQALGGAVDDYAERLEAAAPSRGV